jgi:translation initiation factor IF-2
LQQTKEKIRVYLLAKNLDIESKVILDHARDLGYDVKNQLSSLEPDQADKIKERILKGAKPGGADAARPAAALPLKEKRIVNLAPPRVVPRTTAPGAGETSAPRAPAPVAPTPPPSAAVEARPTMASAAPPVAPPATPAPPVAQAPQAAPAPAAPEPADPAASAPKAPAATGPKPMVNLSGRPPALDSRMRPPPGGPAGAAPPARPAGAGPAAPPRPGGPTAPGTGAPPAPGPGQRHRRPETERRMGAVAQQRGGPGPAGPGLRPGAPSARDRTGQPPAGPAPRRFTAEELAKMRDGKSLHDIIRERAVAAQGAGQAPTAGEEPEEEGDGKKRPGKVVGRDTRHTERAKRAEKRKVRQSVVIEGGHVDVIEEELGSKRGRRASMLKKRLRQPGTVERKGKVPVSLPITVRSLSEATGMKVGELILKLKDLTNAIYTINSPVEVEVAELVAAEKGVELDIRKPQDVEEDLLAEAKAEDDPSQLQPRAPVVTVMGHVDHGKTSLLDRIRETYGIKSEVAAGEIGGITQVIRAWRVEKDGKPITFLDTPGHEAFTKMRARGAQVTDVAVIVVAADDGVMPQTEEAISHAKAAGVAMVVAINKVDLPSANVQKAERQLYALNVLPDTMGGDTPFVYTSAATGQGIDELLEQLSVVAELRELRANPHKPATGTCLEAYLSGDEGVLATLLVQQGTLHRGDVLLCGSTFGRVRAMYDDMGRPIKEAGPSVPVRITGLNEVPNADDHFYVVSELSRAREVAEKRLDRAQAAHFGTREPVKLETLGQAKQKIAELKVILKAEARGSIEAIRKELEKLVHEEVRVRVLHAAIGAITESDVQLALASPEDSMVVGFNVVPDDQALHLAEERGVPIREYNIIYKLTEDIKAALEGKLKPREEVIHLGRAIVREVFKISKVGTVAGCHVTQGTIERAAKVRIIREGAVVFPPADRTASLESLKRFKDDVREVREGYDCGMKIAGYDDIKVGDVIEAYRIEQVQRTL